MNVEFNDIVCKSCRWLEGQLVKILASRCECLSGRGGVKLWMSLQCWVSMVGSVPLPYSWGCVSRGVPKNTGFALCAHAVLILRLNSNGLMAEGERHEFWCLAPIRWAAWLRLPAPVLPVPKVGEPLSPNACRGPRRSLSPLALDPLLSRHAGCRAAGLCGSPMNYFLRQEEQLQAG